MNEAERIQLLVTARLLRACSAATLLSTGLTVAAAALVMAGAGRPAVEAAVVLAGLVAAYFAVRVALDARLLSDAAANRWEGSEVDKALAELGLRAKTGPTRSWAERCSGARRLAALLCAATLLQGVFVFLGLVSS